MKIRSGFVSNSSSSSFVVRGMSFKDVVNEVVDTVLESYDELEAQEVRQNTAYALESGVVAITIPTCDDTYILDDNNDGVVRVITSRHLELFFSGAIDGGEGDVYEDNMKAMEGQMFFDLKLGFAHSSSIYEDYDGRKGNVKCPNCNALSYGEYALREVNGEVVQVCAYCFKGELGGEVIEDTQDKKLIYHEVELDINQNLYNRVVEYARSEIVKDEAALFEYGAIKILKESLGEKNG